MRRKVGVGVKSQDFIDSDARLNAVEEERRLNSQRSWIPMMDRRTPLPQIETSNMMKVS